MERVSKFLEGRDEPVSHSEIERNVSGKGTYVREAIDVLVSDGYAAEEPGPRGSKLVTLVEPFTPSRPRPHHVRTTSTTPSPVLPAKGDGDGVEVAAIGTMRWDELETNFNGAD